MSDTENGVSVTTEILRSRAFSDAEKREILSSWASDMRAIPDAPAWRRLDSGAVVGIDDILAALRALDGSAGADRTSEGERSSSRIRRLHRALPWLASGRRHGRDDDDDDPPPCPAVIAPVPLAPSLCGAEAA
jgi:hypothetical protein